MSATLCLTLIFQRRSRDERPTSLKDRISLLEGAQEGWKNRVEVKDNKEFTVEGKLEKQGRSETATPEKIDLIKKKPKQVRYRSKTGKNTHLFSNVFARNNHSIGLQSWDIEHPRSWLG